MRERDVWKSMGASERGRGLVLVGIVLSAAQAVVMRMLFVPPSARSPLYIRAYIKF